MPSRPSWGARCSSSACRAWEASRRASDAEAFALTADTRLANAIFVRRAARWDRRRNFEKGRLQIRTLAGFGKRPYYIAVKHEELLFSRQLAVGAPRLIGFAVVLLPTSGRFAGINHGAGLANHE